MEKVVRALALSGGGVLGAYETGAIKHLLSEKKIQYDIYAGVSVGAINALDLACFKTGQEVEAAEHLYNFWWSLNNDSVKKHWMFHEFQGAFFEKSLYNSAPLRTFLEKNVDLSKLKDSGKKLIVGTVKLTNGEYVTFTDQDKNIIDGVLASAAFPAVLCPIKIGEDYYVDGGVRNVTPLSDAIKAGATHVDVIITAPEGKFGPFTKDPSTMQVAERSLGIQNEEVMSDDIKIALLYNKLAKYAPELVPGKRHVEIRILRPENCLEGNGLDFNNTAIRNMMAKGYEDAVKADWK